MQTCIDQQEAIRVVQYHLEQREVTGFFRPILLFSRIFKVLNTINSRLSRYRITKL